MRLKRTDVEHVPPVARGNGEPAKKEGTGLAKLREDFLALVGAVNKAINALSVKVEAKKPVSYEFDFIRDEHGLLEKVIATPKADD